MTTRAFAALLVLAISILAVYGLQLPSSASDDDHHMHMHSAQRIVRAAARRILSVDVTEGNEYLVELVAIDDGGAEASNSWWSLNFIADRVPKFADSIMAFTLTMIIYNTAARTRNEKSAEATCADRNVTLLATRSQALAVPLISVGPYLLDQLALGTLNLYPERTNTSCVIKLSYSSEKTPLCEEGEEFLHVENIAGQLLKPILQTSGITNTDEWSIVQLADGQEDDYNLNEIRTVLLFSTVGLFAVFFTFISCTLAILCCVTGGSVLTRPSNLNRTLHHPILNVLMLAAFASSVLLLLLYLFSFAFNSALFYMGTSLIDNILFSDKLFSPYTVNMVFLVLTMLVSFVGGACFVPKGTTFALRERIGLASLYTLLSVAIYHLLFVIVAMFVDFVTVLTSLVVLATMFLLLLLSFASVIQQFRNVKGFSGFLFLVAVLDAIIMSLYGILLTSVSLLITQDTCAYDKQSFTIVMVVSVMAISFCFSIFVLIARKGYKLKRNHQNNTSSSRQSKSCANTERDIENGVVCGDESKTALVPKRSLMMPREVEMILMMAPKLIEAWRQSEKQE